ncbi:hypothetical protein CR492_09425 [Methylocella silvestris]|uniref:Uncharacterized protein n=1 Tax=Methylocella silvestris TaxID=199596 RepID=A0A2J7THS4_METSI|nr:hypothetical protein CR492_09425 [Methylocella silvestris]
MLRWSRHITSYAALILCAGSIFARAEPAAAPAIEPTLYQFGRGHKDCIEWTDGCAICNRTSRTPRPDRPWSRRPGFKLACSTPGIACLPSATTCSRKADEPSAPRSR